MVNPILIDVSKWQGEMNWSVAFAAGARAAIIRAGSVNKEDGQCYQDSQFDNNKTNASQLMPVAYYWYFRPNHSPTEQADFFCKLVSGQPSFRLFADIEEHGGLPAGKVADNLSIFVNEVKQNAGKDVGIYTRASFWDPNVARRDNWGSLDLWIARYIDQEGPWSDDDHYKPRDWDDWKIWQYSADGNFRGLEFGAQSKHIDINVFNGDFQALSNYCYTEIRALAEPEPRAEPVAAEIPLGACRVIAPVLNLRSNASVNSQAVGNLVHGTKLYWFEHLKDPSGNDWLRIGPSAYISERFKGQQLIARV